MKQGSRLEGRLPGAHDDNLAAGEGAEIGVCRTVRARPLGKRGKIFWHDSEVLDSGRHYHASGRDLIAVGQLHGELPSLFGDLSHKSLLKIRNELALEPESVGDERVESYRQAVARV